MDNDEKFAKDAFYKKNSDFQKEPYRRKFKIINYRLNESLQRIIELQEGITSPKRPNAYSCEKELLNDLYIIRDSLKQDGDDVLLEFGLDDFIRLVETFGFFLVNLDIREESTKHTKVICELIKNIKDKDYESLEEAQKVSLLASMLLEDTDFSKNYEKLSETQKK